MGEMVSYIFGTLQNNEVAIRNISRNLKLQKNFNKNARSFALLMVADLAIVYLILKVQDNEIKELRAEIEKLKSASETCEESTESTS